MELPKEKYYLDIGNAVVKREDDSIVIIVDAFRKGSLEPVQLILDLDIVSDRDGIRAFASELLELVKRKRRKKGVVE